MSCHVCGREAVGRCDNCGALYCAQHGDGNCVQCDTSIMAGDPRVPKRRTARALLGVTRALTVEFSPHGVRVNAIAPGPFPTEGAWARLVPPGVEDMLAGITSKKIPAGRFGEPEELVSTLVWLCSPGASFVNGVVVPVDGGFSAFSGV